MNLKTITLTLAIGMTLHEMVPAQTVSATQPAGATSPEGQATQATTSDTSTPMEMCIGGLDHGTTDSLPKAIKQHEEMLPILKGLGMTSHELYVRWNMIESARGEFDFHYFDKLQQLHNAQGVKWVPFLIAGSAYTLPNWFYKGPEHVGYVCLEHNQVSDIASLWNPALQPHVERVIENFGKHYNGNPNIESVLLGITGNYGESIYPASDLDWTQDAHGPYHTHTGWWCGDEYAIKSFREQMESKYKSINKLNEAWGTTITRWADLKPRLPSEWPGFHGDKLTTTDLVSAEYRSTVPQTALQEQTLWLQDAMNDWADVWMKAARKAMPDTELYLVVGGHAPNRHGFDVSAQAELCAKYNVGMRVTNEADHYDINYAYTRMIVTSSRHYGIHYSIEPAGPLTWKGIAARAFNATASGAKNIHWYLDNLRHSPKATAQWEKCLPFMRVRNPVLDTAVYYPRRWKNLHDDPEVVRMLQDFGKLRNLADYDMIDERLMDDLVRQGKDKYKTFLYREDWLVDDVAKKSFNDFRQAFPSMKVIKFTSDQIRSESTTEDDLRKLSREIHPDDDFTSGVYFSRFDDGSLLFLNQRPESIDLSKTHPRMVTKPTPVEQYMMTEIMPGH